MITVEEFNRAQALLRRRRRKASPKRFVFGQLIQCGACNGGVTAEEHVKPSGKRYIYYHCTRRNPDERCLEPAIGEQELERQLRETLAGRIGPSAPSEQLREMLVARASQITLKDGRIEVAFSDVGFQSLA